MLYLAFFLSGAAALIFEQLWFRLASLVFGGTVWAATVVLAAMMTGLALGNSMASRHAGRITGPVRLYALLEVIAGVGGLAVVLVLPASGAWLAPVFRSLVNDPGTLMAVRFAIAFAILLVPATAMGATLPVLTGALARSGRSFGASFGGLYGWNTLGAVAGVLAAELCLLRPLGIRGSGVAALTLDLAAAVLALAVMRDFVVTAEPRVRGLRLPAGSQVPLLAAALCGALLLAFEVVWFRLMLLHVRGSALAFAVMLAVVLCGIGLGGLLGGLWLRRDHQAFRHLPALAAAGGIAAVLGYWLISQQQLLELAATLPELARVALLASVLMAGCSFVSGMLFALLGAWLHGRCPQTVRSSGLLTLANTGGGAIGALLAGFVLLPGHGVSWALFALASGYAAVLLLTLGSGNVRGRTWLALPFAYCAMIAFFPWSFAQRHFDAATAPYRALDGSKTIFVREGLNETVQLLRQDFLGEALAYRLVTNGFSMSNTATDSLRYMKLFAWWPFAVNPRIETALLISHGTGSTASALVASPQLRRIDVVDVSLEVLEASSLVYKRSGKNPLGDPRVRRHLEDGRQFLLLTSATYDLITAEPPPPRLAGVVNLYTREYFSLLRSRLAPQGVATYWLPVDQLTPASARAVIRGFCAAFADCSLWAGSNYNWMLAGTNDLRGAADLEAFTRQWREPGVSEEITSLGFENPGQLGATFIADAAQLQSWTGDTEPLTDDFPGRLADAAADELALRLYSGWMDDQDAEQRFRESAFIRRHWPEELREATPPYFAMQAVLNNQVRPSIATLPIVDGVLRHSDLRVPVMWLLDSDVRRQQIADRMTILSGYRNEYAYTFGVRALAERDPLSALRFFEDAVDAGESRALAPALYCACAAGKTAEASLLARRLGPEASSYPGQLRCW